MKRFCAIKDNCVVLYTMHKGDKDYTKSPYQLSFASTKEAKANFNRAKEALLSYQVYWDNTPKLLKEDAAGSPVSIEEWYALPKESKLLLSDLEIQTYITKAAYKWLLSDNPTIHAQTGYEESMEYAWSEVDQDTGEDYDTCPYELQRIHFGNYVVELFDGCECAQNVRSNDARYLASILNVEGELEILSSKCNYICTLEDYCNPIRRERW